MPYTIDRATPETSALIVIDMQSDFLAEGAPLEAAAARELVPTVNDLIGFCRGLGIPVLFTAHVHRGNGWDMGLYSEIHPEIADRECLIDGSSGADLHPALDVRPEDVVVKKHRFSAFYGTDLDILLRGLGTETLIIAGATTENCCFSTARDAMFRNIKVAFLSDATTTFDYPDVGQGAYAAEDVHATMLSVLAFSTAHVMTTGQLKSLYATG
ncbi:MULTISPECIES: cysteine hydrolase family protein [Actinomadura]|uniref:Cysteine hydrolase family protein n=1 Tax=Actinomadura yumaensis TaxID=111807 RepID=A0ABW2CFA2_9ACTN|nr:isochorismatase family cysteine hydrolase [Actinomadura sp. J1-007]MWK35573.1 isochorismatase family protein [Actinomadura sp. J1-007]